MNKLNIITEILMFLDNMAYIEKMEIFEIKEDAIETEKEIQYLKLSDYSITYDRLEMKLKRISGVYAKGMNGGGIRCDENKILAKMALKEGKMKLVDSVSELELLGVLNDIKNKS